MAVIYKDHFSGGSNVTSTAGNSAQSGLAAILRDIAADFAGIRPPQISASAAVVTAAADATDDATVWALANDLKAKFNAAVTLMNEIRTDLNAGYAYTIKTTAG